MKTTYLIAGIMLAIVLNGFAQVPAITTQPQSQQVLAGTNVTLSVSATSATAVAYQWVVNGRTFVSQTNASLDFNNVQVTNTGSYYVILRNSAGSTNSAIARLEVNVASAPSTPLALTGWNADGVLENSPARSSQGLDPAGASWFEAGLDDHGDGLPNSRRVTSVFNTNVIFVLQPYGANNILALSTLGQSTGTLTLGKPTAYKSLSILATSGNGGGNGTLDLSFTDGTIVSNLTFSARDWYDKATNLAIAGLGRDQSAGPQLDYQNAATGFGMFETDIDLAAAGLANKLLQSLTFTKPGQSWVTAVFAVSGERTEPPVRITYPLDGQAFILPTNLTIVAEASFPFTTVTNVEFFQGTTKLGEVYSEPFSVPWNGFGAGTYSLSIRATDDQGTSKTSDAVTVTIYPPNALFAVDDAYSIAEDNTLSVPAPGLLANDRNVSVSTAVSLAE